MRTDAMLTIMALPAGGYVVLEGYGEPGSYRQYIFAATDIGDALKYIRSKLTAVGKT